MTRYKIKGTVVRSFELIVTAASEEEAASVAQITIPATKVFDGDTMGVNIVSIDQTSDSFSRAGTFGKVETTVN